MAFIFFFFNATPTTQIYTLSLHDALPISTRPPVGGNTPERQLRKVVLPEPFGPRSEEHTSELQSRVDLVCRLLLEKKNGCRVLIPRAEMREDHQAHPGLLRLLRGLPRG